LASFSGSVIKFRGNLIKKLSKKYSVYVFSPNPDQNLINNLKKYDAKHINIPLTNFSVTPIKDFIYMLMLSIWFFKLKPKKVLAYTIKPVTFGGIISRIFQVDFFAMITGLGTAFESKDANSISKNFLLLLLRISLKRSKKILFYNTKNQEYFLKNNVITAGQSLIINGSGVDTEYYKSEKTSHKKNKKINILCMARLLKDKGIIEYISSAEKILDTRNDVNFFLLGDYQKSKLSIKKSYIDDCVNRGIIKYHGFVEDVRPYIEMADIYILASYHEGLPRSALEAMSMSKAIILSEISGTKDLIQESVNGFYCKPKSIESLTLAINKMLERKEELEKFGQKSRQIIEKNFDDRAINNKIMEVVI